MTDHDRAIQDWIRAKTPDAATAAVIRFAQLQRALLERRVPGADVGEPMPDEWEPVDWAPPEPPPARDGAMNEWVYEI